MLATTTEALMIALGIGRLWSEGFIETVRPPPLPAHIFAQQVMGLTLQEEGIARGDCRRIGEVLTGVDDATQIKVIGHMLAAGILAEDSGVLGLGPEAEAKFGRRHFQELVAAFTTPLLLAVRYGSHELGSIDPQSLNGRREPAPVILLGGRSWHVLEIDWPRRAVSVKPAAEVGRSRWFGSSRALHAELAHSTERVLATGDSRVTLSNRARASFDIMREAMPYINGEVLPVVSAGDELRIWTFAGGRANAMLANALHTAGATVRTTDNFGITLCGMNQATLSAALDRITDEDCQAPVDTRMMAELKFGICLPDKLAEDVLRSRLSDFGALHHCLQRARKWIRVSD